MTKRTLFTNKIGLGVFVFLHEVVNPEVNLFLIDAVKRFAQQVIKGLGLGLLIDS